VTALKKFENSTSQDYNCISLRQQSARLFGVLLLKNNAKTQNKIYVICKFADEFQYHNGRLFREAPLITEIQVKI